MNPSSERMPGWTSCAGLLLGLALLLPVGGCRPGGAGAGAADPTADSAARAGGAVANARALERDVRYLADDRREGRGPGSAGLDDALHYVAGRYRDLGLAPPLQERPVPGGELDAYLQPFTTAGYPPSANAIGILPAQPTEAPHAMVVIVAAHVDHLGRDPQLSGDQIYNGADDNASGVATMLEIARLLAQQPNRARAVVFIAFSGEESGMLGSQHYVQHPIVPLDDVLAMINLDSVGKLRNDQLIVFGMDSAREFPAILAGVNQTAGFRISEGSHGVDGSDHRSFRDVGIPALHFFTGAHRDFSKVSDEADGLNYEGLARLSDYVTELTRYFTYRDRPLTFVAPQAAIAAGGPSGHPAADSAGKAPGHPGASGPQRRVSLGFMPDFAGNVQGVRVAEVTAGGAAAVAGLAAGDIITAIDGEAVNSLQDYTMILRIHVPGDEIIVRLLRDGATREVTATLQERQ